MLESEQAAKARGFTWKDAETGRGSAGVLQALETFLEIKPGQTSRDGLFSLEVVACIGACGLAPVICVNGEFHAKIATDGVKDILDEYRRKASQEDAV